MRTTKLDLTAAENLKRVPFVAVTSALTLRMRDLRVLLPVLIALLMGCASHDWACASDRKAYATLVESSPSFQRARTVDGSRVVWFIEQRDSPPQIYVGFDMGTHTCRSATLRIREGVVERQEMKEDGELVWIRDEY